MSPCDSILNATSYRRMQMKTNKATPQRILTALAVMLFAAPVVQASTVTITGPNVTLLAENNINHWVAATDTTQTGGAVTVSKSSTGALAKFDSALGVLTNVVATATNTNPTQSLVKSGGGGTASASSSWTLGGNAPSGFTISQSSNGSNSNWKAMTVTSSANNLNNFVGSGNVASNNFYSTLSANKSSPNSTGATGARISPNLTYSESVVYTYSTHGNASFTSPTDTNAWNIDFGALDNGAIANQAFSIFDLGDLGLTNFSFSFLTGDDVFDIIGGNSILAGSSGIYSAKFLDQSPSAAKNFSGTYRLSFLDDTSGLAQFASNSVGSNYIDLTMVAAQAPAQVPEPESLALVGLGLGLLGMFARRRKFA